MAGTEHRDTLLRAARLIEQLLAEIPRADDSAAVFDLERRANEAIATLPPLDHGRLSERLADAVGGRLQELREHEG